MLKSRSVWAMKLNVGKKTHFHVTSSGNHRPLAFQFFFYSFTVPLVNFSSTTSRVENLFVSMFVEAVRDHPFVNIPLTRHSGSSQKTANKPVTKFVGNLM